jgi:hypothetical protein
LVNISLDLSKREIEILLYCLDSAIDIVKLSEKEKERAIQIRDKLAGYL